MEERIKLINDLINKVSKVSYNNDKVVTLNQNGMEIYRIESSFIGLNRVYRLYLRKILICTFNWSSQKVLYAYGKSNSDRDAVYTFLDNLAVESYRVTYQKGHLTVINLYNNKALTPVKF